MRKRDAAKLKPGTWISQKSSGKRYCLVQEPVLTRIDGSPDRVTLVCRFGKKGKILLLHDQVML